MLDKSARDKLLGRTVEEDIVATSGIGKCQMSSLI